MEEVAGDEDAAVPNIFGYVDCESDEDGSEGGEKLLDCETVVLARSVTCVGCGDDGAERISAWLRGGKDVCKLRRLSLRRKRGSAMSATGASRLADMLATNTCLVELDLADNRIGARGATRLAESLRTNTSLRSLDLTGPPLPFARTSPVTSNGLLRVGLEGARALADVIGQGECSLEALALRRNGLGQEGLGALCLGLRRSSRLRALDVSCNGLGDEALPYLQSLLWSDTCNLRVLDLTVNRLSSEGAIVLSRIVAANTSLRLLCIDEIEDEGMAALRDAVETSSALEDMHPDCKLAFCMSMHPRLGAGSPARWLTVESCAAIVALLKVPVQRRLQVSPAENLCHLSPPALAVV